MTMVNLSQSKSTATDVEFSSTCSQSSLSTSSVSIELASDVSTYKQYHNNSRGTNAEPHLMQHHHHHHHQYHQQPKSYDLTLFGGQFLVSDTLYFEVPQSISDSDIVTLLTSCQPILTQRNRYQDNVATGWIQFANKELADRAYTLFDGIVFKNNCRLQLYMTPDGTKDQIPNAPIFQVNHLPLSMTNDGLYNLFRPYGPIRLCKIIVEKDSTFKGTALLQYFNQQDAENSKVAMDSKYLDGKSISIFSLVSNKPDLSSPANKNKIGKSDSSSVVDFTNLYIKNLDLTTKSADLYSVFRVFGPIISARVMKKPNTKQSRGYGFVSFTRPEDAKAALTQFNGKFILSKPVIIAYHEPKRLFANSPPPPSDVTTTPPPPIYHQQKLSSPLALRTSFTKNNKTHQTPPPQPPHYYQHPNQPHQQHRNHQTYQQNQQHRVKIAPATIKPALPVSSFSNNSNNTSPSSGPNNDHTHSHRDYVQAAILKVIGKDKELNDNLNEWVDYIMSLRSASRTLCLLNTNYLLSKLEEAPTAIEAHRHHQSQNHYQKQVNATISSYCCQPQQQHQQYHHYTCASNTPKTPNLVQPDECNSHTSSSATSAAVTSTTSTTDIAHMHDIGKQDQYQSMARFVESMKGLSLLQQKQQLGDILFPHVKATGTKHASKVTIQLLDTQPLDQLAYSMHSLTLLKPLVDEAFLALTRQRKFTKAVMQK